MFKPDTLHDAYCLAKLQEATLASIAKKTKPIFERSPAYSRGTGERYGSTSQSWNPASHKAGLSTRGSTSVSSTGSSTSKPFKPRTVGRTLSSKKIEERRAKNLCFFCEEKYFPGHKFLAQVYRLKILEEELSNDMDEEQENTETEKREETGMPEETLHLYLSALNGISTYYTIRVTGRLKNSPIHILINSAAPTISLSFPQLRDSTVK